MLCACGDDSGRESFLTALDALREGSLRDAEAAAQEAARRDPEFVSRSEFLRGNIAFARCEMAAKQAATPGAEPFAWDVAIQQGERARDFWRRAAMSRADWPGARRNVERALLKLAELRQKKATDAERRRRQTDPKPKPQPKSKPPQPSDADTREPDLTPQLKELSAAEVLRLIERLAQKEREKIALRGAERKKRMASVEKDW